MSAETNKQLSPNLILIDRRKKRGWDSRRKAARELHRLGTESGLRDTPTVEAIDKALYRHETGRVAVTDPLYRKLYCLAYDSTIHDLFGTMEVADTQSDLFTVRSHKFVPAFIGADGVERLTPLLGLTAAPDQWTDCRTAAGCHPEGDCTVYAWPFGVVIYHLVEELHFDSLAALALWRQTSYGDNRVWATEELQGHLGEQTPAASYVLGAHWVIEPLWSGETLETALRILCTPKVLLKRDATHGTDALSHAKLVEQTLLNEGYDHPEIVPFGIKGISMAYASWSGVVYHPTAPRRALTEAEFIACELATQAIWTYSEHINTQVENGHDPIVPVGYGWRFLRAMRSRLTTPRPEESGQHRSMRNAIVATSDLIPHLAQAIETLREAREG